MSFRPLPKCLTIKQSTIDGLGLFATSKIFSGTILGVGWVKNEDYKDGFVRTPLGGFINHSDEPNCVKLKLDIDSLWLQTNHDIESGEELTVTYTLYNVRTEGLFKLH